IDILLSDQFQVTVVTNKREALHHIKQQEWDLVIINVMMPNMLGNKLIKQIRKQYSMIELPIILLTEREQSEDVLSGFLAGANDYVSQPIDRSELKMRVKTLVKLKQSISERLRI